MVPPYTDENIEIDEVAIGMEAAENDTRDAITDAYENSAQESDDPEEALDDIDYTLSDGASGPPELNAVHEVSLVDIEDDDEFEDEEE